MNRDDYEYHLRQLRRLRAELFWIGYAVGLSFIGLVLFFLRAFFDLDYFRFEIGCMIFSVAIIIAVKTAKRDK